MDGDDDKRFLRDRVTDIDREFSAAFGSGRLWATIGIIVVLGIAFLAWSESAKAQEHKHPPQDQVIHERFYSTWMMPDNRAASCCHNEDCSPAESKFENGHWLARKVGETGAFTPVPPQKIERERDSPDGRSHLCGRHYVSEGGKLTVFCFIAGGGA